MKTLKDWLPHDYDYFDNTLIIKNLDKKVISEYSLCSIAGESRWKTRPFKQYKNIMNWCILENDYAIGWNENPSRGWSFPVIKIKKGQT